MRRQPFREIESTGPTNVMLEQPVQLGVKSRIVPCFFVSALEFEDERHQGLGDETPTIVAEMPALVRA
jgi:hypothetical protein